MANKDEDEIIDVILEDEEDDAELTTGGSTASASSASNTDGTDDDADEEADDHADFTAGGELDEDREAIRERRRKERQERKARTKERADSLKRELSARDAVINEMREKLAIIERRNAGGEIAQLVQAREKAVQAYDYYKDQIRAGTEAGNGTAVAEATEQLMQVRSRIEQLASIERSVKQRGAQPPPLDQRVANNAREWTSNNNWYDPQGKDQDSRVVLMLDQTLAEEGWDPLTKEYWDELGSRVKKYLPHRANRDIITADGSTKPKSVVAGSGRESSPRSTPTFRLSAERVKALKDAGKWDDPVERNKMIKQYRDYDRNNEGAR